MPDDTSHPGTTPPSLERGHGGRRVGAGRKPRLGQPGVQVTATVPLDAVRFLDMQAQSLGLTRAEVVAVAVGRFARSPDAAIAVHLPPSELERLTELAARLRLSCAEAAAMMVGTWLDEVAGPRDPGVPDDR